MTDNAKDDKNKIMQNFIKSPRLLFVFGTRPECIKTVPLILEAKKRLLDFKVCFTGQHMDMALPILNLFNIKPDYNFELMIPGQKLTDISVAVMNKLQKIISEDQPTHIIVQGDTTTAAIAGLTAFYNHIQIIHIEAGLRTFDMMSPWPEEFNRRILGLAAHWHFTPTSVATNNLLAERANKERIFEVGNTGIDALRIASEKVLSEAKQKENSDKEFNILVTLHRRESFGEEMQQTMLALKGILEKYPQVKILWPLHQNPNVKKAFNDIFKLVPDNLKLVEPLNYLEFVKAMNDADLIVSDSGGVQEEAPFLGKPLLVCRNNTERPEAIACGSAKLVGTSKEKIISAIEELLNKGIIYQSMSIKKFPYGDGRSAEKIFNILEIENFGLI